MELPQRISNAPKSRLSHLTSACLLLFSISAPWAAAQVQPIETFAEANAPLLEFSKKYAPSEIWIVLDIDDTLIRLNQTLGGEQWFDMQGDLLAKNVDSPHKVADSFPELLRTQGLILSMAESSLIDESADEFVQIAQKQGYPIFALTARGPFEGDAALRELLRNGMDFSSSAPALKNPPKNLIWTPYKDLAHVQQELGLSEADVASAKLKDEARPVAYTNGIFLSEGQHKGVMLRILAQRAATPPKAIVFIDNKAKHVAAVSDLFAGTSIEMAARLFAPAAQLASTPDSTASSHEEASQRWLEYLQKVEQGTLNLDVLEEEIFGE